MSRAIGTPLKTINNIPSLLRTIPVKVSLKDGIAIQKDGMLYVELDS